MDRKQTDDDLSQHDKPKQTDENKGQESQHQGGPREGGSERQDKNFDRRGERSREERPYREGRRNGPRDERPRRGGPRHDGPRHDGPKRYNKPFEPRRNFQDHRDRFRRNDGRPGGHPRSHPRSHSGGRSDGRPEGRRDDRRDDRQDRRGAGGPNFRYDDRRDSRHHDRPYDRRDDRQQNFRDHRGNDHRNDRFHDRRNERGGEGRPHQGRPHKGGGGYFRGPSARKLSIRLLTDFYEKRQPIDYALDKALNGWEPPDRRDVGLVHEMVIGTVRHQRRLDQALQPLCTKPLAELSFDLVAALRIGLYQLFYLDRVPDHAAIKETVSAMHEAPGRMVNAVLREAQRRGPDILEPDEETAKDPKKRAAVEWSMPDWIIDYFAESYSEDDAIQLAQASHRRPQLVMRVNEPTLKRDDVKERMKDSFPLATSTDYSPLGLRLGPLGSHGSSRKWVFLNEGFGCVQDEASQLIGLLMDAQPGERILDFCAAPGGKTTLMASAMKGRGMVVAVDRTLPKRRRIQQLASKLGLTNVWVESTPEPNTMWPINGKLAGPPFDGILVDAPCSGLGTLARRPDLKWLKEREDLNRLADLQIEILKRVWPRLRPGGRLVYSTCTLGRIENQDVVTRFLEETKDAELQPIDGENFPFLAGELVSSDGFLATLPHRHPMDGMFAARFTKR